MNLDRIFIHICGREKQPRKLRQAIRVDLDDEQMLLCCDASDHQCSCRPSTARTYRHTNTQTHRHTQTHTDTQTYRHTPIQTYTHTDIHPYTHTHTDTDLELAGDGHRSAVETYEDIAVSTASIVSLLLLSILYSTSFLSFFFLIIATQFALASAPCKQSWLNWNVYTVCLMVSIHSQLVSSPTWPTLLASLRHQTLLTKVGNTQCLQPVCKPIYS